MDLDLDRMLRLTRRGQWSIEDIDWHRPLAGAEQMDPIERRDAGLQLLFTAGLERQAAKIFLLCAEYIDDQRAAEIYQLFYQDELRHAEAEIRLAARYGVGWNDLPPPSRWMFRQMDKIFIRPGRGHHEVTSATILLFELALDTLLIPALKEQTSDDVQAEVFRRIDQDESRHLAMDYWLLDRKGGQYAGQDLDAVIEETMGPRTRWQRLRGKYILYRSFISLLVGMGAMGLKTRSLRKKLMAPERVEQYLSRVRKVPERAPRAMEVPAYRMGLGGLRRILRFERGIGSVATGDFSES